MALYKTRILFGLILGLHVYSASATIISLDPVDSGEILYERTDYVSPPGFPPSPPVISYGHDAPLDSFSLLWADSAGCLCEFQYLESGYLIYDLSAVSTTIQSASLVFDLSLEGDVNDLAIYTIDAFTPDELMMLDPGSLSLDLGEALYEDMGSGTQLGTQSLSTSDTTYNVNLNAAAIDLINGADTLLAFGLDHPISYYDQADINFTSGPRLVLDDGMITVPEPATLWLMAAAIFFLRRSRGRSAGAA